MIRDSELEKMLLDIEISTTPEFDERVLTDAFAVLNERAATGDAPEPIGTCHAPAPSIRRFPRIVTAYRGRLRLRVIIWSSICLFGLVAFGIWTTASSDAWAQVENAVRSKRWIHGTAEWPDGQQQELWFSPTLKVSAGRKGAWAVFDDCRLQIRHIYEPEEKQLYRVPYERGFDDAGFRSIQSMFAALFRGDKTIESPFPDTEIVEQEQRRIKEDGRIWIEYDLLLRRSVGPNNANLCQLVFRVDPQSRLPHSMQLIDLSGDRRRSIRFVLDYPEHGPIDIFALGVPRAAKLVDRVPHDDLNRLLEGVKTSLERFDNYRAYVVEGGIAESQSWPGESRYFPSLWRIYRKGMRWRLEAGLLRPHTTVPELPQPGADLRGWVREYAKRVNFVPISLCDGKAIYQARLTKTKTYELQKFDHWKLGRKIRPELGISEGALDQTHAYRPELLAYPSIPVDQLFETKLDTNPRDGPSGTVRVTSTATGGYHAGYTARYWIAPSRSFAVMKWEWERPGKKPRPYIIEKVDKSPNGIWYPTVIRWKTGRLDSDGKTRISDQITLFFLDFDADLPNSLFVRE